MKKTMRVVMLPTEKQSNINIWLNKNNHVPRIENYPPRLESFGWVNQHLYIISDEEIKEGDWCYDKKQNKIYQATKVTQHNKVTLDYQIYKIIATTDVSLGVEDIISIPQRKGLTNNYPTFKVLPQIPESFIKAYIKDFNEHKPITDVNLEIEEYDECILNKGFDCEHFEGFGCKKCIHKSKIKTREDNTVIIHRSKTYSKAEVIELMFASMNKGYKQGYGDRVNGDEKSDLEVRDYFENWIEKNDKNF